MSSVQRRKTNLHFSPFIPKKQYKPSPRRTAKRKSKRGSNPQSSSRSHKAHGSKNQSDGAGQNGKRKDPKKEVVKKPSCEMDSELGDKYKPQKKGQRNGKSCKGRKQSLKMKPVEIEQFTSDTILESSKQESSNSSQCTGSNEGSLTKQEEGLPMSSRSFTSEDEQACHNDTTTPRISSTLNEKMTPTDIPQSARQQTRKKESEQATLVMSEEAEKGNENKQVVENHHVPIATSKSAKTANTGENGSKLVPQNLHKSRPLSFLTELDPVQEQNTPDAAQCWCSIPVLSQMVFSEPQDQYIDKSGPLLFVAEVGPPEEQSTLDDKLWECLTPIEMVLNKPYIGISLEEAMGTFVEQGFPSETVNDIIISLIQTKEHYRHVDTDFGFDSRETLFQAVHVDFDEETGVVNSIIIDKNHVALDQSHLNFILILKEMVEHFLKLWYDKHPQDEQNPAISRLSHFVRYDVKYQLEVLPEARTLEIVKEIL